MVASTGNGTIHSGLPLQTSTGERGHMHGQLNGGGPSLQLHSGDGSITLTRYAGLAVLSGVCYNGTGASVRGHLLGGPRWSDTGQDGACCKPHA